MKRFIICLLAAMVFGTNAMASVDLIEPYGFSAPLSDISEDSQVEVPSSFTDMVGIEMVHTKWYDAEEGVLKLKGTMGNMTWLYAGAKSRVGADFIQPHSLGKTHNSITFKFNISEKKKRGDSCYEIEKFDICQTVTIDGVETNFMLSPVYMDYQESGVWAEQFTVKMGDSSTTEMTLQYDTFYTFTVDTDVQAGIVEMTVTDENGGVIAEQYYEGLNIDNVFGGIRLRLSDFIDADIKNISCYRDMFVITEPLQITESDGMLTATVSIAEDAGNACGEPAAESPILLIGQYDIDNRLISFQTQTVPTEYRSTSSTSLDEKQLSVSLEKNRDFDHAVAYLWTNENDCLAYCDTVELSEGGE